MLGSQLQNIDSASTTTFDVSGAKRTASGAAGAARRAPLDASAVGASQAMIVRTKLQARASAASKPAETTATFRSSPASLGLLVAGSGPPICAARGCGGNGDGS